MSKIIDKGSHLKIINGSDKAIFEALIMAREKFGRELEISGDDAFKVKVIKMVDTHKMDIIFKDSTMRAIQNSKEGISR